MARIMLISLFGIIGVLARYGLDVLLLGWSWPASTTIANVTGSFVIGIIYGLGLNAQLINPELRIALMVGLLGGFTTFSSYALQTILMVDGQKFAMALTYGILSPIAGFLAAWAGLRVAGLF